MDSVNYRSPALSKPMYLKCSSQCVPCPQILGYTLGRSLGSGSFAKVKAAWSPFEAKMIAIKIINKSKLSPEGRTKFLPRELEILQKLSHPNIIGLFQIIETERHCFVALEIAENGDLLDYLCTRGRLLEAESRFIFNQMCQAVSYCHSQNIAHRDLKLENVFFSKTMDVKIGDFGFALESKTNLCTTPCGPYWYGAPEVSLMKEYNPLIADSWSMGMIVHVMVCGGLPFGSENPNVVKNIWAATSKEFKAMVEALLTVDTRSRPTVADILNHDWIIISPSTRPTWTNTGQCKFTNENCLPSFLHGIKAGCHSYSQCRKVVTTCYPRHAQQYSTEAATLDENISLLDCSSKNTQNASSSFVPISNCLEAQKNILSKKSSFSTGVKTIGSKLRTFFRKLSHPKNVS